jgi:hypothetical protein
MRGESYSRVRPDQAVFALRPTAAAIAKLLWRSATNRPKQNSTGGNSYGQIGWQESGDSRH